jgi:predicted extracellular nuclease
MMKRSLRLSAIFALIFLTTFAFGQSSKKDKIRCISFYNLENLYDTINQPDVDDEEFTPAGKSSWDSKKYQAKLTNMSEVISKIGKDVTPEGPAVMGLCEIENLSVLKALVAQPSIKKRKYQIVHFDSPDKRGIDVALIYQAKYFKVTNSTSTRLFIEGDDNFFSRDQLVVSGVFDGEPMHFIVNHWPSRSGGQEKSEAKRIAAAQLSRHLVDSLLAINPKAKIMVMGDLNDDPSDVSVSKYLNTTNDKNAITGNQLFNPMADILKSGTGTLQYRDKWNLFDQIILSPAFFSETKNSYQFKEAQVFNKSFLIQQSGDYKGYPLRTFGGKDYLGGYSDHFPVMVFISRKG